MTLDRMISDKMSRQNNMTKCQTVLDWMNLDKMAFDKMPLDKMTSSKMTLKEISEDKMTFQENVQTVR